MIAWLPRRPRCSGHYRFWEGETMKIRKKLFADFEYEEVLDTKTRELIRVGCAVAVGCPT